MASNAQTQSKNKNIPEVEVAAIKFNHDTSACTTDAMNIRINYNTAIKIPEWDNVNATPSSSVAYSIKDIGSNDITIKVKFTSKNKQLTKASIKAEDGGILGEIESTEVNFSGGISDPEYIEIKLKNQKISQNGVANKKIDWNWSFSEDNNTWSPMGKTEHKIYVVLETPKLPWKQDGFPTNNQLPWAEALEKSCTWAEGSMDIDDAAKKITQTVNSDLGLKYDIVSGGSAYSDSDFDCTLFLTYGKGKTINCTDCATIATSFVNLLGGDLKEAIMTDSIANMTGFKLNKIIGIGSRSWGSPFSLKERAKIYESTYGIIANVTATEVTFVHNNGNPVFLNNGMPFIITIDELYSFSYHEVPWMEPFSDGGLVYDACLKVDSSNNRHDKTADDSNRTALLPVKMQFSEYKDMLCVPGSEGVDKCIAQGPWPGIANSGRRPVK